eukprot:scaffold8454_cov113-Skeletonema_marinoi.AAC.2
MFSKKVFAIRDISHFIDHLVKPISTVLLLVRTHWTASLKKRQCHRLLMMLRWKDVVLVASSSKADGRRYRQYRPSRDVWMSFVGGK